MTNVQHESDVHALNQAYYERNATRYEAGSWYYFNGYKSRAVSCELRRCIGLLAHRRDIEVLEIGPGTGYLLGKLLAATSTPIRYTCVEHAEAMADILHCRYATDCESMRVIKESISGERCRELFSERRFDLILGGSILHHLPDYHQVVAALSNLVRDGGVMYFVREPLHRDDCAPSGLLRDVLSGIFGAIHNVLMMPAIRKLLWPRKVRAENARNVAIHMFRDGVSLRPFREITEDGFFVVFHRRYNRRVSTLLSYLDNVWLAKFRKDIFSNTLFSIGLQKKASP